MTRILLTTLFTLGTLFIFPERQQPVNKPAPRDVAQIVKEISDFDKEYNRLCKLIMERQRFYSPYRDATLCG